jgi:hypothetical protein
MPSSKPLPDPTVDLLLMDSRGETLEILRTGLPAGQFRITAAASDPETPMAGKVDLVVIDADVFYIEGREAFYRMRLAYPGVPVAFLDFEGPWGLFLQPQDDTVSEILIVPFPLEEMAYAVLEARAHAVAERWAA